MTIPDELRNVAELAEPIASAKLREAADELERLQSKLDRVRKIAAERPWLYAKDLIMMLDKETP